MSQLKAMDKEPDFKRMDQPGKNVKLSDFKGRKILLDSPFGLQKLQKISNFVRSPLGLLWRDGITGWLHCQYRFCNSCNLTLLAKKGGIPVSELARGAIHELGE